MIDSPLVSKRLNHSDANLELDRTCHVPHNEEENLEGVPSHGQIASFAENPSPPGRRRFVALNYCSTRIRSHGNCEMMIHSAVPSGRCLRDNLPRIPRLLLRVLPRSDMRRRLLQRQEQRPTLPGMDKVGLARCITIIFLLKTNMWSAENGTLWIT